MTAGTQESILNAMRSILHFDISRAFFFLTLCAAALAGCGDGALIAPGAPNLLATWVSAGENHTCAVTGGKVQCWGLNTEGQLGDGTTTRSLSPVFVTGITDAVEVHAGARHTCARLSTGAVWCWGDNFFGQLGNGTHTDSLVPIQPTGVSGAVSVSAGLSHSCAVRSNGSILCWGRNVEGQLGNETYTSSTLPVQVFGIATASTVSAGGAHTCARLADSTLRCWGSNTLDQLGKESLTAASSNTPVAVDGVSTAVSISSGTGHSCAEVGFPSRIKCWGDNYWGQLARSWTVIFVPPSVETTSPSVLEVTGITTPAGAAAGYAHSCGVLDDNTVRCWGDNSDGQLGNGNFVGFTLPHPDAPATSTMKAVSAKDIISATQVATGQFHSCALLLDGSVMCWGKNSSGQLGDGTGIASSTPVQVLLP